MTTDETLPILARGNFGYLGGIVATLRDVAKKGGLSGPNADLLMDAAMRIETLEAMLKRRNQPESNTLPGATLPAERLTPNSDIQLVYDQLRDDGWSMDNWPTNLRCK